MKRVLPWLFVAAVVAVCAHVVVVSLHGFRELRDQLDLMQATARSGRVEAAHSQQVADSLRRAVTTQADTISALILERDLLGKRLAARIAAVPMVSATMAGGCSAWAARADSLAGALAIADTALRMSDSVIVAQQQAQRILAEAADTLGAALDLARRRLTLIDSVVAAVAVPPVLIPRPSLAAFGAASLGRDGPRLEAGFRWRGLYLAAEQGRGVGTTFRVGVRRAVRIF